MKFKLVEEKRNSFDLDEALGLKENIYIRDNAPIKEGDYIIFDTMDDELAEWKDNHPSKRGYKVVEVDREKDGTPTGMYFIENCPYAIDHNEDNVEKINIREIKEDTIKQNGKWVNKGKEGTHGTFKTKKAADQQRKAMFARGYQEDMNEALYNDEVQEFFNKAKKLGARTYGDLLRMLLEDPAAKGDKDIEKLRNYYKEANPEDKTLSNESLNESRQEYFTKEEQEEFGIDEDGYEDGGYGERWIHCDWCGEPVPSAETKKELNLGFICNDCQDSLYSRGERPVYDEYASVDDEELEEKLIQGKSDGTVRKNTETEIKAGKAPKQAYAIAKSIQRKNMKEDLDDDSFEQTERAEIIENGKEYWVKTEEDEKVWNSLSDDDKYLLSASSDMGFWFDEIQGDEETEDRYYDLKNRFSITEKIKEYDDDISADDIHRLSKLAIAESQKTKKSISEIRKDTTIDEVASMTADTEEIVEYVSPNSVDANMQPVPVDLNKI